VTVRKTRSDAAGEIQPASENDVASETAILESTVPEPVFAIEGAS
jgi:hypothetical protein